MFLKSVWKPYLIWILCTEWVGLLSGLLTRAGVRLYNTTVVKPPLSPPSWVFPIVWAILFALMGVSAARIARSPSSAAKGRAIKVFFLQLGANVLWSLLFFNLQAYGAAFLWILVLWLLILWMVLAFLRVDRPAALLQLPYLLWVAFAALLNFMVWRLN